MRSRYSFLAFQMRVLTYIKGLWLVSVNSNGRDGGSNAGHYGTISCALTLGHIFLAPYALSVWFSSIAQSFWFFETPWTAAHQASLSITNSWSPPKPMSTESVMLSNHLILCCPLLLLPPIFSSIRVFSSELAFCTRWPKHWSFSFSLSNEYSGLISLKVDWFDLLTVQGTLTNLP